ncbi:MAG: hypothetical protein KAR42_17775 [candidate division Zixibacteria bacterium]|nr:hypothetical protein [candidate division Zixibacteria bacterium]
MSQKYLYDGLASTDKNHHEIGNGLVLDYNRVKQTATLYRMGTYIKKVDFSDNVATKLFVTEMVELGANKSKLALVLNISRQTVHNYVEIKKHFGLTGLIHGNMLCEPRNIPSPNVVSGNKAQLVAEIRQQACDERGQRRSSLIFLFSYNDKEQLVENSEQPFVEEHDWEATRYAGVFSYLIPLVTEWKWLQLVMGYFGAGYKIFMIFLLMAARNIRSIEQLKNVRVREAGAVLGIKRIPSRPIVWQWFYSVAKQKLSELLKKDYFQYQIRAGLVSLWLWFTDGHLLPYTGKKNVRWGYNTQRRMPFPGQTNMVTCDVSGRVVDFEIQEGKGDLRNYIKVLCEKWAADVPECPGMVFDREGNGTGFFSGLVKCGIPFSTWEKDADAKKLATLDDALFITDLKFNNKEYSYFEGKKSFTYIPENSTDETEKHRFTLRRFYLWNKSSNRRTSGLAWSGTKDMNSEDCVCAILSRWGASENTFKHLGNRHPQNYHPGFKLAKSEHQDIANPAVKEKECLISRLKNGLNKLYKKFARAKQSVNKDGTPRKNSYQEQLKNTIAEQETELKRLQQEKSQLPNRVDVSTLQNYRSFQRIDNEGKNLFDFVTCSVWNARKLLTDWLCRFFNQDNELVDLFYAITDCHGWIKSTKNEVIVRLEPLQQPKRRLAQEQLCRRLTAHGAQTPQGKWLVIEVGESPVGKK